MFGQETRLKLRSEVPTAVSINIMISLNVTLCSLVDRNRSFGETRIFMVLHLQIEAAGSSKKIGYLYIKAHAVTLQKATTLSILHVFYIS
jgi:hypothetical protein